MPTYSEPKSYDDNSALTEAMLDEGRDYRTTFLNTTKIASDNIQTGGIATANIADSAITAGKIASDAVTTAKILDANVTAAKLASDAVTTTKILDAAVTQAKRAALGQQLSSSSGTYSRTNTAEADVTNLSVSITTTGRPVMLLLVPDGDTTNSGFIGVSNGSGAAGTYAAFIYFERDGSNIAKIKVDGTLPASPSYLSVPPSSAAFVDTPAAGTYTYKVACNGGFGATVYVERCKLLAYEL